MYTSKKYHDCTCVTGRSDRPVDQRYRLTSSGGTPALVLALGLALQRHDVFLELVKVFTLLLELLAELLQTVEQVSGRGPIVRKG